MKQLHWLVVFCLLLATAITAFAGLPQTISYQGYLTGTGGTPAVGPVSMVFSLYSSNPARNNHVWREIQSSVPLTNGIFSTRLGSVTPISAPFDVPYYLGVKVGSDPEMALQPLSAAGYAFRAATADGLSGSQGLNLPANGLTVGTTQLVASGGRIGIGTASPAFTLDVNGTGRFTTNLDLKSQAGSAQIGFNRNSTNGAIYDNTHNAWQIGPIGTLGDKFHFISYWPNGIEQTKALTLHPDGTVDIPGAITSGTWNGSPVGVAYGGTGASDQNGAINNLLPAQTGNGGKVLGSNGSSVSWVAQAQDSRFGTNTNFATAGAGRQCTIGEIILNAGYVANGMPANGQILSVSQYSGLYSLIGTLYGGDGITTFKLPDLRGAAPNGLTYSICINGVYPTTN